MDSKQIYRILKEAANFELREISSGPFGTGAINMCPECETMNRSEYINEHYPKMRKLLESLPWEMTVENPRMPKSKEYPTEDGTYITMMDCNEHEVCTNKFRDGHFTWMDRTHIKWWMKLPE